MIFFALLAWLVADAAFAVIIATGLPPSTSGDDDD